MISEETRAYYDLKKRNDVRESAKRIRRQFLRYKDAEIIYSLQHKKILELENLPVQPEPFTVWMVLF